MIKTSASQLKAKMGRYMQAVRSGKEVVVTDRNQPVALLVPIHRSESTRGRLAIAQARDPSAPPLGDLKIKSIAYRGTSTTALLTEDRDKR